MYRDTLTNSLNQYKIFIQCENGMQTKTGVESTLKKIDDLQEYINKGGEISRSWLEVNYGIISKAVKHHHDFIHKNEESSEEHRELNILMKFYSDFYQRNHIDFTYMSI